MQIRRGYTYLFKRLVGGGLGDRRYRPYSRRRRQWDSSDDSEHLVVDEELQSDSDIEYHEPLELSEYHEPLELSEGICTDMSQYISVL